MEITELIPFTGVKYKPHFDFWNRHHKTCKDESVFRQKHGIEKNASTFQVWNTEIDTDLAKQILSMVNENDVGIYVTLISALSVLFKKYSKQDCIVLHSPVLKSATEKSVNSSIPVIIPIENQLTWKAHLIKVQGIVRDSYRYQQYPLKLINPERTSDVIAFSSNVLVRYLSIHEVTERAKYDLVITFERTEGRLRATWEYDENFYDRDYIVNAHSHFSELLKNVNCTSNTIAQSSLLSTIERDKILLDFNNTTSEYPAEKTIQAVFEGSVMRYPDHPAILTDTKSLSYRELNESANKLAHYLRSEYNIGANSIVGLMINRSEQMLIGILGILKAGAAYLPIDPTYPEDRKSYMLSNANINILLTDSEFMFELPAYAGQLFALDIQLAALDTPSTNPLNINKPNDLAYVIYTSGSTGQPKGVMIEHCANVNLTTDHARRFGITHDDRVLQFASLSFDASVFEIFTTFLAGATIVLIDKKIIDNTELFESYIQEHKVSIASLPITYLNSLKKNALKGLKTLITGGESPNIQDALTCTEFCNYFNAYGPTEAGITVATYLISEGDSDRKSIPIGKPISNVEVYVVDEDGDLVPIGFEGELYVSGAGVARGYLNNPSLTQEKFIELPVLPGKRLYRTGDRVKWAYDGNLEFIGRVDDQIKLRGYRIELGEIASILKQHKGVQEVCVMKDLSENLSAFVVPHPLTAAAVRSSQAGNNGKVHESEIPLCMLPNGMPVFHKNKFETDAIFEEIFQRQVYNQHGIRLPDNATIIDVGANIGMFSLYAGLSLPKAKIYAFEPVDALFDALSKNASLYGLNVKTFQVGLSNTEEEVDFLFYPNNTAMSGRYADITDDRQVVRKAVLNHSIIDENISEEVLDLMVEERVESKTIRCSMKRLSAILCQEGIETIDLLKIDTEKSELEVLEGIDDTDWNKIRQIVIEVHNTNGQLELVKELLIEKGYDVVVDEDITLVGTGIYNLYAVRGTHQIEDCRRPIMFSKTESWTNSEALVADLKKWSSKYLPSYMVPHSFKLLNQLPVTSNGKVDKKALLQMSQTYAPMDVNFAAPRNAIEKQLMKCWKKVLGRESIGIHDNFFEIGGDSIKAIQISSRMYKFGYKIDVKDIFQNNTIASLSPSVKALERKIDQSAVQGVIPLTPVQKYFFETASLDSNHYNQAVMLNFKNGIDEDAVVEIISKLHEHHDALRIVYQQTEEGVQQISKGISQPVSVETYNLVNESDPQERLTSIANSIQASIALDKGPLMKVAQVKMKDGDRLLIVVHHLVIDVVSWRILLEDIETLLNQYKKSKNLELPFKTDSFKVWSEKLSEYANSAKFLEEIPYWKKIEASKIEPLKKDHAYDTNLRKDAVSKSFNLSKEATELLLTKVNAAFSTEINDILLTALGLAIQETLGHSKVLVGLEGHGREDILAGVNINRTVGWFTSLYPIILDVSNSNDLSRQIIEVKEHLHKVPNKGVGYGILKYLTADDLKDNFEFRLNPEITFNYLGQIDSDIANTSFSFAQESTGNSFSPNCSRPSILEVSGIISNGVLDTTVIYNRHHYSDSSIDRLCNSYQYWLNTILSFCALQGEKIKTPSDLTYKDLSIEQVESLRKEFSLEDVYPLSHLQEGILFHSLLEKNSSYFNQFSYRLQSQLEIEMIKQGFAELIQRHTVLRTVFNEKIGTRPLQIVTNRRPIDFYYDDITGLTAIAQEEYIATYKQQDKDRNFDLGKDVLMRLSVLRINSYEYEFIWSFHHILMDGWCFGILSSEFFQLYNYYLLGGEYPLSKPTPYKVYIEWLEKCDQKACANYWSEYLLDYNTLSTIPRASKQLAVSAKNSEFKFTIDPQKKNRVSILAKQYNVTLSTFYQTLWGILLGKYNNCNDVVFGKVVSGRPAALEGVESMVGLFINTLPVRIRYNEDQSFDNLVAKVQQEALESEAYHHYSLASIQSLSNLKQNLLDHIFVYENYPVSESIEGLAEHTTSDNKTAGIYNIEVFDQNNYDLNVLMGDDQAIKLVYNPLVFEPAFIQRIPVHIENILTQVLDNAHVLIKEINILSYAEELSLLTPFHCSNIDYPKEQTIQKLFELQAKRTPNAVALTFENQSLTFRELNEKANQLAYYIRKQYKVKQDNLVGLMVNRSVEMVVSILGILKAGGAYVPIDPDYPESRILYTIEDSGIKLLITDQPPTAVVKLTTVNCLDIKDQWQIIMDCSVRNLKNTNKPEDLAYIIYTSGSTGQPKGVMIEHRNVVRLLFNDRFQFDFSSKDVWTVFHSICFDFSVWEIFGCLLYGGRLIVIGTDTAMSPESYANILEKEGVTVLNQTPGVFDNLSAEILSREKVNLSLRYIIFGGEALKPASLKQWYAQFPSVKLVNMYGITETTVHVTYKEIDQKEIQSGLSCVGHPIPTTQVYLLNDDKKLVPVGVTGEIVVGGEGLARGYLNKELLTKEKFITNPFNVQEKLYCSGDLGVYTESGELIYVGRKDNQVKIRGYRIELGEIENMLLNLEAIEQAVVISREDNLGEKQILAYYKSSKAISNSEVKSYAQAHLPSYMVPAYFVALDSFPLTSNNKIDRKLLPDPIVLSANRVVISPRNETEAKLWRIWCEVLGHKEISMEDNFFEIGGHSLKAMQVVSRIYKDLNYKIELKDLFIYPTISQLRSLIEESKQRIYEEILPVPEQEHYDLSHAQKRLWILSQFEEGKLAYNMPSAYVLKGVLDHHAFEQSVNALIERHESLRTTFITIDDQPRQKVHNVESFTQQLEFVDLRNQLYKEERVRVLANEEAIILFDLECGPIFRVKLIQVEDEMYILLFTMHHIISDGWSIEVMLKDMLTLYNNYSTRQAHAIVPLNIQYKDYAHWQNSKLSGEQLKVHQQYWKNQFDGELPTLNIATDYPRPMVKTYRGDRVTFMLGEDLSKGLKALSKRHEASLFMTLLACVKTLLYRYTGQEDIVIGTPVAGRDHFNLEDQIGLFLNTIALRTKFSGSCSFNKLLAKVKTVALDGYTHQIYPFDKLVDELSLDRDTSRSALFDVMVVLQNTEVGKDSSNLENINVSSYGQEVKTSKFDLTFTFREFDQDVFAELEYNTDIYSNTRIDRMVEHLKGIISSVVANSETALCSLSYLSDKEKHSLSGGFNPPKGKYPNKTIHGLFEAQVRATPDARALTYENTTLTYSELNAKANQLAHYLRKTYSIKGDDLIGILMDRTDWMIVAILGVLKSGAGYVPLDTSYPRERNMFMIEDAAVLTIITDESMHLKNLEIQNDRSLCLKDCWEEIENCSTANPMKNNKPSALAYIIYTSGSTGNPKGVMIEHRNVVSLLFNDVFQFDFNRMDTWTLFHSICFDFSVWEIFGALLYGSRLVVVPKPVTQDPDQFANLLEAEGVTILNQVPSVFGSLIPSLLNNMEQRTLNLRYIVFGGEALKPATLKSWYQKYPQVKLVNMYGITETTVHVSYKEIGKKEIEEGISNIGKPIPTLNLYVMDEFMQLVPVGVEGELVIGGAGVARGYLNLSELTGSRFVTNPHNKNERLYRSGDLGIRLENGDIKYIKRKDKQVKIRGFRIELGEIEKVLMSCEGVENAVVTLYENQKAEKVLVAYYTSDYPIEVSHIKHYAATLLPAYMIPSCFEKLAAFPLTANGKINYKALPVPNKFANDSGYVSPRNPLEIELCEIWQSVLGAEKIGVFDNFFELGGHSLNAMQLILKIQRSMNFKFVLKDIFTHPTVAALAQLIERHQIEMEKESVVYHEIVL